MPRYCSLPEHAPLTLCRNGKSERVLRNDRALRAIKELMAKSGLNLDEFALHAFLWRDDSRVRRRHIETSEAERGEVEVRRDQGVYA